MGERDKISITIRKDLLKNIDNEINGVDVRNRSHAIEVILSRYFTHTKIRKAFILAGGLGTRLRPLTYGIPKPLIPIGGKPLLEHTFNLLKDFGVDEIILAVGYKAKMIEDHFGDGSDYGLKVRYVREEKMLGTAGPLRLAKKELTSPFFMLNGDIMVEMDLNDLAYFHFARGGLATVALTPVEDISHYGAVDMKGFRILQFAEKPKRSEPGLINAGVYVIDPKIIDMIPEGPCSIEKEIFPKLAKEGQLYGYPFHGKWIDTGTLTSLDQAKKLFG